jgi:hypothetical protein
MDLRLTNSLHDISQPVALDQFYSDHLPVFFDVYSGSSLNLNPQTKIPSYKNTSWLSFMSYLNQELDLQVVSLSTIGGPPDTYVMVNHLTSCILEAKNIAVPNFLPYRYTLKLTEEISDLIRFRNQFWRRWGQNKNRELKKFVNKLTQDIRLRVFVLRGRKWGGLVESCQGNQTKLWNFTKLLKNSFSGKSVFVTNLEESNLITNAFSNVYQSHDFTTETSTDIIRNLVIELTPYVPTGFSNRGNKHNPIILIDKSD